MVNYNGTYLDNIPQILEDSLSELEDKNKKYPLTKLFKDKRNLNELSIDFINSSAQIEGNTYSRFDTEVLIKMGQTVGGKPYHDAVMLMNIRSAFEDILNSEYEIDYGFVCSTHDTLTETLLPKGERGIIRNKEVVIGGSRYIPLFDREQIHSELKYLIDINNKIDNAFQRAIHLHLNLCYLQAFVDGNKRTARILQNAVLVKCGMIPIMFDDSHLPEYIESVVKYYETGESKDYVKWFIKNYNLMYEKLIPNGKPNIPKRRISDDIEGI